MAKTTADKSKKIEFKRDPRKAKSFFEHAAAVAETRSYDYAIDCYINGLKHDPDNMAKHEALREVALRRKVAGGKPPGIMEKIKGGGRNPIDKMLHAEMLWSKNPLDIDAMIKVMTHAIEADLLEEQLNFGELAYWVGDLVLELAQSLKKPTKRPFIQVRDLFASIPAFGKAVEACKFAVQLDEGNTQLLHELKELEAERTMQEGGYNDAGSEKGFLKSVRNIDKQRELELDDSTAKSDKAIESLTNRRRQTYQQDVKDLDNMQKLVDVLLQKDGAATENEAIDLLQKSLDQTGQYRYKAQIGNIKIKQIHRDLRLLKVDLEASPTDQQLQKEFQQKRKAALEFELEEYKDRATNYPTDMRVRFELGRRLYALGQHEEAIGAFQQAKADPKHRAAAHEFLGRCYMEQGWFNEAIDTLNQGIEVHGPSDDRLGMELRYLLMDANEQKANRDQSLEHAQVAQKIASQILQTNISYKDIRERINSLRELVAGLQSQSTA